VVVEVKPAANRNISEQGLEVISIRLMGRRKDLDRYMATESGDI
jgi:hypothetical protein